MNFWTTEIFQIKVYILSSLKKIEKIYLNPNDKIICHIKSIASKKADQVISLAIDYIENYKNGKIVKVPPLNYDSYTENQIKIYNQLLKQVKFGKKISYGELAKLSGLPKAARFVGTTMKNNNFPIIVPCHRVIKASGDIGNYSAGKNIKRILLDFESTKH